MCTGVLRLYYLCIPYLRRMASHALACELLGAGQQDGARTSSTKGRRADAQP